MVPFPLGEEEEEEKVWPIPALQLEPYLEDRTTRPILLLLSHTTTVLCRVCKEQTTNLVS